MFKCVVADAAYADGHPRTIPYTHQYVGIFPFLAVTIVVTGFVDPLSTAGASCDDVATLH